MAIKAGCVWCHVYSLAAFLKVCTVCCPYLLRSVAVNCLLLGNPNFKMTKRTRLVMNSNKHKMHFVMFITSLVLLFILELRFPSNESITATLRNKYGQQTVHTFRKLETLWRKRDKTLCDIEFLKICYNSNITPKFLRIKVYRYLQSTSHVGNLQHRLLEAELQSKGKHLKELQNTLENTLITLQSSLSLVDFNALKL